ncbi:hypothetical protein JWG39_15450 [Desulforhopalus vacuolatus]|uniref:hypothetical protein n=1 Tax=Desulforhopalus vacuolatus TaxID=40414 RepID=UPI0019630041|nr:hypothetical protein [Desulforhopalus vacuolatus]MBM9521215.1 hypothetical protein [Desulforhopalus vacuolatus]
MRNYTISPKKIRFLVNQLILMVNIGWLSIAFMNKTMAVRLVHEDGIIQWLQFLFLLFTALFLLRIVLSDRDLYENKTLKYGFFILFVLTLVLAGEEISWGQRIFNITTPDFIKQVNVQNEITLHNLWFFQRFRHWLLLIFGLTGLVLIHLKTHNHKIHNQFVFFYPPASFKLAFYFIIISGVALEVAYISLSTFPGATVKLLRFWAGRYSEIGELGVSITAFSYAEHKFNLLLYENNIGQNE